MRNHTSSLWYELTSEGGSKSISITPSASAQSGKFLIGGIAPRVQDMRNYMVRLWPHLLTTFDADAAGNAVNWDKLAKGLQSCEVISPVMGVCYPHFHTQGAALMHLISVIALGYEYPQGARAQIPTNTDADYTIDLFYVVPFAQECLIDPLETAQWTGFFDSGSVEMIVAPSTVYDGDYAGAVIKAPTTLRCLAETIPSQREFIGVPFQWRRRSIAGGGASPTLKNVGGETSLNGISPGAGLAALYWLTNATGIGLGGPDGVDNILSISMDWRGQKNIQNLDGFFHVQRALMEKRTGPISLSATVPQIDAVDWPKSMASTNVNRPSADAETMFLPIVAPGRNLHTSKLQRVLGDLSIDFTTTDAVTNAHEFMSLEFLEWSSDQANAMSALGLFRGAATRKNATGKPGKLGNFRYTAIEFENAEG